MPKAQTFPTLYDDMKSLSTSALNEHGYLKPNHRQSGTIIWSRDGKITGSISIQVSTEPEHPFVELDYKYGEKPISYRVRLISVPSNLGKGVVWYFLCPVTGKRCRKLYFKGGYFLHREAFKGCLYRNQTESRRDRALRKLRRAYEVPELITELYRKHAKSSYAGKPTKRHLRLSRKIEQARSIPVEEIMDDLFGLKDS